MPGTNEKAYGPFQHGNRWRVRLVIDGRFAGYRYYESESEGKAYVDTFRRVTETKTIGQVVRDYLEHLARHGGPKKDEPLRQSSLDSIRHRLTAFLQLEIEDRPLTALTPAFARKLYEARKARGVRVDTLRGELSVAKVFGDWWLVRLKLLKSNPFADIKAEGTRNVGKATLKLDDARTFLACALDECTEEGLMCALILVLGLRVSELTDRTVDDVNSSPPALNVPRGKTRAAKRLLGLPAPLSDRLLAHIRGKARTDRLFTKSRYSIHHHVMRLCKAADVPVVCPHGLRGSAATNIVEANGATLAGVESSIRAAQAQLGHENAGITVSTYIAPGTIETATAAAKMRLLGGNELGTVRTETFPNDQPNGGDRCN